MPCHGQANDLLFGREVPCELFREPPDDPDFPARTLAQAVPSHGTNLNALLYGAAGPGPHPTVLLLHGLPGNEQNLDCAQSIRRAGWNVLTIHYRGSWGGPGSFSFGHCLEDAVAALDWMLDEAVAQPLRIDPKRIAIVGHSMGGFVAAHLAAGRYELIGAALISGVDLGNAFGSARLGHAADAVDENVGFSAGLHILSGTSASMLAHEARSNADSWRLAGYASRLADRPSLIVTSDDGFAQGSDALAKAIQALGGDTLTLMHFAADHSYSACRIQLQAVLLRWLKALPGGQVEETTMPEGTTEEGDDEGRPSTDLSKGDKQSVSDRSSGSAKVVHEVVRLQGNEELDRPLRSLLFSGFAAGVAICASLLAEAFLHMRLPDAPWAELIVSIGYTVGFVIVILGNLQLFTESTVTVLPLATHPSVRNLGRLLRLWAAVFAANMAGTLLVATLMAKQIIIGPEQLAAAVELSRAILAHGPGTTLLIAMPAGFLIASIAWILPNARGSEFWVITLVTYVIAIGGFSHVVAGAAEAWLLMLSGQTDFAAAAGGFVLPALVGNIIGGTGLFAVVAHGQVRAEIDTGS